MIGVRIVSSGDEEGEDGDDEISEDADGDTVLVGGCELQDRDDVNEDDDDDEWGSKGVLRGCA